MSDISSWSSTDDKNNEVSPSGFPENMPPSAVNNSARAVMGGVRRAYLEQPYFDVGGVIQRLDDASFSIADTQEITDFTQYFTVGRRVKIVSSSGLQYGNVGKSTYDGGVSNIKVAIDGNQALLSSITSVLCGLAAEDAGEVIGRLPVGMILPYTANDLPAGFLFADGGSFDPDIYTELARIWKTGDNTWLYGQEVVGGKYWVKTPDVRGQFPRYLDKGAGIDPDGETREIGSTQGDAIRNITGTWTSSRGLFEVEADGAMQFDGNLSGQTGGGAFGSYKTSYSFDASRQVAVADENRPKNIAFPALIVAWHGITPAENITIQDLLTAFNQMQEGIDAIYEAKDAALIDLQADADIVVSSATTSIQDVATYSVALVEKTASDSVELVNSTTTGAIEEVDAKAIEIKQIGNDEQAKVTAEGVKQVALVVAEGNTQATRVEVEAIEQIAEATAQANRAKGYADSIDPSQFALSNFSNTNLYLRSWGDVDLNDFTESGVYFIGNGVITNNPTGYTGILYGVLQVFNSSANIIKQTFMFYKSDGTIYNYERSTWSGQWKEWRNTSPRAYDYYSPIPFTLTTTNQTINYDCFIVGAFVRSNAQSVLWINDVVVAQNTTGWLPIGYPLTKGDLVRCTNYDAATVNLIPLKEF